MELSMNMSELMGLPMVRDAIRQKQEAELKAAAAARGAVLQQIERLQADLDKEDAALASQKAKADKIRVEYDAALSSLRQIEARRFPIQSQLAEARKRLYREFGEDTVTNALNRLDGLQRELNTRIDRLSGIDRRRLKPDDAAATDAALEEARTRREMVKDALQRVQHLVGAKLAPDEIRHQVRAILGAVLDEPLDD